MKFIHHIKNYCSAALLVGVVATVALTSCSENIDESALYTFTGEMMIDHFENHPETFSSYLTILNRVHPSKKSTSTMYELLAARGHYTCFAPTNEAIQNYLNELQAKGELTSNALDQISDSVAQAIVFNSIIQNGEEEAYATTDFVTGPLGRTNMNDRYVTISFKNDESNNLLTYVNKESRIINGDIEVENGYIHTIDKVLAPSDATVADLVMAADNMTVLGKAIALTGWNLKVQDVRDDSWTDIYDNMKLSSEGNFTMTNGWIAKVPETRKFGFTIFAETDDVYARYGITDIPSLKAWVKSNNHFDDDTNNGNVTSWGEDYTNDYNWLNQFVAYHILPEALTADNMVIYANEKGWYAQILNTRPKDDSGFSVNVWEYYETMGVQHRSLKITGCKIGGKRQCRINRLSHYRNTTTSASYAEYEAPIPGIQIDLEGSDDNDNNAINGFFYPIDDILIWNADVPQQVLNERMRYDITSLFPEMITNNSRANRRDGADADGRFYFPDGYLSYVTSMSNKTEFCYLANKSLQGSTSSWCNYQIDEFNIQGIYDFTMKLPPVPYTGTYEIRYGINANDNRGMAQIYIGTNKDNLPAYGTPIDLRQSSGASTANTGWVSDDNLKTMEEIQENTKSMRNMGFMKGPQYITFGNGTGRGSSNCLRKIIYNGELKAGVNYYIRFKSVLTSATSQFFYDYLEFVPKSVYAADEPEDIW